MQFLLTGVCTSSTSPTHVVSLKYMIIRKTYALPNKYQSKETFY